MGNKNNKDGSHDGADIFVGASTTGDVTGFTAGVGTASKSDSTWGGSFGSTKYTVGDIVTVLKRIGVLAA